jgi:hypothetical protein
MTDHLVILHFFLLFTFHNFERYGNQEAFGQFHKYVLKSEAFHTYGPKMI